MDDAQSGSLRGRTPHFGGIAFMVLALLCFGMLDTTTKYVSATVPVVIALWVRYAVQTVLTAAVLWPGRGSRLMRTTMPGLQLVRGMLLLLCSVIAYVSLRVMQVGEFTAIVMLTPLLLTVIAALALREHVSWLRWGCVIGGFAGSLLVIQPGAGIFQWAMLLPLLLVVANAGFQTLTSHMARTEDPATMHLWTGLVGLAIMTVCLPLAWQSVPPMLWLAMTVLGLLGTLGHFLLIVSYSRAPVAVLTPYLYLQIAFATLAGWLAFQHVPDAWSLTGIALVALFGIIGTWLAGREALARGRADASESRGAAIAGVDAK